MASDTAQDSRWQATSPACHWHRISHSDPDAAGPAAGPGKVFTSKCRVLAAQSQVTTGPEPLAPAVVSRHKVRKCIG